MHLNRVESPNEARILSRTLLVSGSRDFQGSVNAEQMIEGMIELHRRAFTQLLARFALDRMIDRYDTPYAREAAELAVNFMNSPHGRQHILEYYELVCSEHNLPFRLDVEEIRTEAIFLLETGKIAI